MPLGVLSLLSSASIQVPKTGGDPIPFSERQNPSLNVKTLLDTPPSLPLVALGLLVVPLTPLVLLVLLSTTSATSTTSAKGAGSTRSDTSGTNGTGSSRSTSRGFKSGVRLNIHLGSPPGPLLDPGGESRRTLSIDSHGLD